MEKFCNLGSHKWQIVINNNTYNNIKLTFTTPKYLVHLIVDGNLQ